MIAVNVIRGIAGRKAASIRPDEGASTKWRLSRIWLLVVVVRILLT
jgi:hypothetical protein